MITGQTHIHLLRTLFFIYCQELQLSQAQLDVMKIKGQSTREHVKILYVV